jgi:hypothetical protein
MKYRLVNGLIHAAICGSLYSLLGPIWAITWIGFTLGNYNETLGEVRTIAVVNKGHRLAANIATKALIDKDLEKKDL